MPSLYYASQERTNLGNSDVGDWLTTYPRKRVVLESVGFFFVLTWSPFAFLYGKPLTRYDLKTVSRVVGPGDLQRFALCPRIDASSKKFSGFVALLTRIFQARVWIDTHAQGFPPTTKTVIKAPPARPVRIKQ
jgi:hypothetical protein